MHFMFCFASRSAYNRKSSACSYNIHHSDYCDFTSDIRQCSSAMDGKATKK